MDHWILFEYQKNIHGILMVVDFERSAAAVIGLSKLRLSSCAAIAADQYCIYKFKFYCLFYSSCPRRPYRRAALQLGEAPSRLYIFGRLGSRAPRGPGRPGPPAARQAVMPCTCRTSTLPLGAEFPGDPEVFRHGTPGRPRPAWRRRVSRSGRRRPGHGHRGSRPRH